MTPLPLDRRPLISLRHSGGPDHLKSGRHVHQLQMSCEQPLDGAAILMFVLQQQ